jgi:hypothetical protein
MRMDARQMEVLLAFLPKWRREMLVEHLRAMEIAIRNSALEEAAQVAHDEHAKNENGATLIDPSTPMGRTAFQMAEAMADVAGLIRDEVRARKVAP